MSNDFLWRVDFPAQPEHNTSVFAPDQETAIKYLKADPLWKQRGFPKKYEVARVKRAGA